MNILITGSNGFVGRAAVQSLMAAGHGVIAQVRSASSLPKSERTIIISRGLVADFTDISAFQAHLEGVEAVVHCAARVHQVREACEDPLAEYRRMNTQATLALARAAAQADVKRFVFLSSVKVNGEFSLPGQPFSSAQAEPQDPYGLSKLEAELGLQEIAAQTGMEVVIIRPPLVYGPGVKANFLTMMRVLHRGIPLPFGAIANQRSLVALPNLVDFISLCLSHPKAANQTFMISDQQDVSTTELLSGLGQALHRPARLLAVPQGLLRVSLKALGKGAVAHRLMGDLTVDSTPASTLLGWRPAITVQQGLQLTANHFLQQAKS